MSSFEALTNYIHREAERAVARHTQRTPAVVDSYDPQTHAVKVKFMPDSEDTALVSGWIPLHPIQTGNNFGWHMPPNIGDHVWVEFHDDDREAGQVVVATFNDQFQPINTVQAGEWLYKNKWGASVYFKQDGSVAVMDKNNNSLFLDGNNIALIKQGNSQVQLNNNTVTISTPKGEIIIDGSGNIQVFPTGTVFLGGTGSDGSYAPVVTLGGPAINVQARYG